MRNFVKPVTAAAVLLASLFGTNSSAQLVWESRSPLTQKVQLNGVAWAASKYVAVGAGGNIWTSADTGKTWVPRVSTVQNTKSLYAAASSNLAGSNSQIVAVGQEGILVVSTDGGATWTTGSSGVSAKLSGITWSPNLSMYVAVGDAGTVITSTNGTTWTQRPISLFTDALYSVTWSNSTFVAVGAGGNTISSSNGVNWVALNSGTTSALYAVTSYGGEFIAAGAGGALRASPTGTSGWVSRTSGVTSPALLGLAASGVGGGKLVAVGTSGTIRQSTEAVTWGAGTSGTTLSINAIAANAAGFLAVGTDGIILGSTDGQAWTTLSSYFSNLNGATARFGSVPGDTQMVVVGDAGLILGSTNSGNTWTKRNSPTSSALYAVASGGTLAAPALAAVGSGTSATITSTDGLTWTSRTLPSSTSGTLMFSVAANATASPATTFAAVGSGGTIYYSTNAGSTWAAPSVANEGETLNGVTWGSTVNAWVAVGDNGAIRRTTAPAGTWANTSVSGTTNRLNAVAFIPAPVSMFVAVGNLGTITTSANGSGTWVPRTSNSNATLRSITWTGSLIVVSGDGGLILTSPNGIDWTTQTTGGITNNLLATKWDGKQVVATGAGGRIITSSPAALPPAPTPQYPSTGITGVPVTPAFSWASTSGALTYSLQVSTSPAFGTTVVDTTTTTNATFLLAGLLTPAQTYYWRIRTNGSTGNSAYTSGTAFTVISSDSAAPFPALPTAGATGVSTSPTLSWAAYPNATQYRLQVSTSSTFASTLANDTALVTTTRTLQNLPNLTQYYWRVSVRLPTGLTAWSATRSFTTSAPTPPIPVLSTPADSTIGFPTTGGTLKWLSASGATAYKVQVSTTPAFTSFVKDTLVQGADTLRLPTLSTNTGFYWHVWAENASGSSLYSSTRFFTTATIPGKPVTVSPANAATAVSVFTDLTWGAVSGAVTYQLQLSTDSNFATTLLSEDTITGVKRNVATLANNTVYYWRVRAKNPAGYGSFSDRRVFTSGTIPTTAPAAPVLVSPDNFVGNIPGNSAVFRWRATFTAMVYRLEISTDPGFAPSAVAINDSMITDTTKTVTTLNGGVEYYWRVTARNNVSFGPASEIRLFTTVATLPAIPALIAPAQFDSGISVAPTLSWGSVIGATKYHIQVATTTAFSGSALVVNDTITSISSTIGPLGNNSTYYWKVRAINAAGASEFATTRRFTTGIAPLPATPTLIFPAQFADPVSLPATLRWSKVGGATSYRVQLSASPFTAGAVLIVNDSTVTDTTRPVSGLASLTAYYWKVSAKSSAGSGEFSGIFKFTTGEGVSILGAGLSMGRQSMANAGVLRFSLANKEHVVIRMFNTDGRKVAVDFDRTLESGVHAVPLPKELSGSFFLVEFKAGNTRQIIKVHP